MLKLTDEEVLENIGSLQYDDEFLAVRETLLKHAVFSFNIKLVGALLEVGANPNITESGDGFLHDLVHVYGSNKTLKGEVVLEIVRLLLEAGANPNLKGCNNLTPLQLCRSVKAEKYQELLLKYGADPCKEEEPV